MPKRDIMTEVTKAIENRPITTENTYVIGVAHGKIICIHPVKTNSDFLKAGIFTSYQLMIGLTAGQWNNLEDKLRIIFKDLGK